MPLIRLVACAGVLGCLIGASLTLADYVTRGWDEMASPAPSAASLIEAAGKPVVAPDTREQHIQNRNSAVERNPNGASRD